MPKMREAVRTCVCGFDAVSGMTGCSLSALLGMEEIL